jgi:hypothetical protein
MSDNPVIQKIIQQQEESEMLRAIIRTALSDEDKSVFELLMTENRNNQKFLVELVTVRRVDGHPQMTEYKILKHLNETYTKFVVYRINDWFITINDMSPYVLEAFTKQEFKTK